MKESPEKRFEIETKSPEETRSLSSNLSRLAFPGFLILLKGDLGAGKTLFASGLAKGLGIEEAVTSPTFNILKVYEGGSLPFIHIDAYRLNEGNKDIGLEDYIYGDGLTAIEWPNFIEELLPRQRLELELTQTGENSRRLLFIAKGNKYIEVLDKLEASL